MPLWNKAAFLAVAAAALLAVCATGESVDAGSVVSVEGDSARGFRLVRNGQPFRIHGAAGIDHLEVLAACGGNAIRTWDAESAGRETGGESLLDRAQRRGIAVTIGLWLGHERHGFRYDDPTQVERQRQDVESAVRRFKSHPALLTWGLGNEMEGPTGNGADERIWKEVNRLAELIKSIDPDHPVMTVVANVNDDKVAAIVRHAPAVDILGINAYGGASGAGAAARRMGWRKPYCVTEYGLPGPWETAQTDWNAPIEPTSRQKAATYATTTNDILADETQCLGTYVFLWGSKQEATASWFGMFLPTGEKTITVDAVAKAWTGNWPANRAPVLEQVDVPFATRTVPAATTITAVSRYRDPEGKPVAYIWEVRRESDDRKEGGDRGREPDLFEGCIVDAATDGRVVVRAPREPGAYRLFVTVRDGDGSGCMDNWPFAVVPETGRTAPEKTDGL